MIHRTEKKKCSRIHISKNFSACYNNIMFEARTRSTSLRTSANVIICVSVIEVNCCRKKSLYSSVVIYKDRIVAGLSRSRLPFEFSSLRLNFSISSYYSESPLSTKFIMFTLIFLSNEKPMHLFFVSLSSGFCCGNWTLKIKSYLMN